MSSQRRKKGLLGNAEKQKGTQTDAGKRGKEKDQEKDQEKATVKAKSDTDHDGRGKRESTNPSVHNRR